MIDTERPPLRGGRKRTTKSPTPRRSRGGRSPSGRAPLSRRERAPRPARGGRLQVQASGVHAVMALDPGGTTGAVTGLVEIKKTFRATIATMERRHAIEVKGSYQEQAAQLSDLYHAWQMECLNLDVPKPNRHVVAEDFVLRLPATNTNLTSIWVVAAFHGAVGLDNVIEYAQASQAKTFAKDERLRLWGLWERGSAHKRDAWRHFALKVNALVG